MMAGLVLVWGAAFPAIRLLGESLDPFQITWFRYALFPLAYGAFLALRRREVWATVSGRDWAVMGCLGLFGVVGYHFPLNWGMHGPQGVSSATGAILVATGPIFIMLLAILLGQEKLRPRAALGSLVAFAGVTVVVLYGRGDADLDLAARAALILLAPMSWAVYSVLAKPMVARYGGIFVTGVTMGMGTLSLLPLGVWYGVAPLARLDAAGWGALLFLAILSTLAGYAVFNHALKHRRASDVAVFIYFQPVISTVVGALVLDEPVTRWLLAGSSLVLAGIVLVNQARLAPPGAVGRPAAVEPAAPGPEPTPPARTPPGGQP